MTLINQIEAASGPSRELDYLIWIAVNAPDAKLYYSDGGRPYVRTANPVGHGEILTHEGYDNQPPAYTSSIDAALTLVPTGMRRRSMTMEDGRASTQLCWPGEPWPDQWGELVASEPLAIVLAALKARGDA